MWVIQRVDGDRAASALVVLAALGVVGTTGGLQLLFALAMVLVAVGRLVVRD